MNKRLIKNIVPCSLANYRLFGLSVDWSIICFLFNIKGHTSLHFHCIDNPMNMGNNVHKSSIPLSDIVYFSTINFLFTTKLQHPSSMALRKFSTTSSIRQASKKVRIANQFTLSGSSLALTRSGSVSTIIKETIDISVSHIASSVHYGCRISTNMCWAI